MKILIILIFFIVKVGAIILYTYVYAMLAPPPEGTFDIKDQNIPVKHLLKDTLPAHVPLLVQEVAPTYPDASKKEEVRDFILICCLYCHIQLKGFTLRFIFISQLTIACLIFLRILRLKWNMNYGCKYYHLRF